MVETPNRIESLLEQGEFLTRLARALVRDPSSADDLVQETWLAALRRPPEGDARSWFSVVARNLVRRDARTSTRRESRERSVARPDIGPSPEEIQRRESVRGLVVEKVLALPESYRTVVLLRFFEGWKPRRIARELGCPVETVNTRLKRALDHLRDDLDRENEGKREVWALALIQAGRVKLASVPIAKGVLLLGTKTKIAVGVVLVAGLAATAAILLHKPDRPQATLAVEGAGRLDGVTNAQTLSERYSQSAIESGQERTNVSDSDALKIRVVDTSGNPVAALPLRLVSKKVQGSTTNPEPAIAAKSTEDGYVVVEHVLRTLRSAPNPWDLVHDVAFETPPTKSLDEATLSVSPVLSVQPDSGSIEVNVTDVDGTSVQGGCEIKLSLIRDSEALDPTSAQSRPSWSLAAADGHGVFPWTELGRRWEVLVSRSGTKVQSRLQFEGPKVNHATEHISVTLGSDHLVVEFRAVDGSGSPLANVPLEIDRHLFLGAPEHFTRTTDAEGHFRVDTEGQYSGQSSFVITCKRDGGPPLLGRVLLKKWREASFIRGGDVVLEADPLLVSGQVVNGAGAPVFAAEVIAQTPGGDHAGLFASGKISGRSAPDGSFELHGLLPTEDFDLVAIDNAERASKMTLHSGATDVRVVLASIGILTGALLVPDELLPAKHPAQRIEFALTDSAKNPVHLDVNKRLADNTFMLTPIPPGTYTLVIMLDRQPLLTLEGIVVSGRTDIGAIDLTNQLHTCKVSMIGAPQPDSLTGLIVWRPSSSTGQWVTSSFKGSGVLLATPTVPIDMWVRPQGYRHGLLTGVSEEAQYRIVAPLLVHITLRTEGKLPTFPYLFSAEIEKDGASVAVTSGPQFLTEDNKSLHFLVSALGNVHVRWRLDRKGDVMSVGGPVLPDHQATIEIRDISTEQEFLLDLPAEDLAELVAHPPF